MDPLYRQSLVQSILFTSIFVGLIFLPAWTWNYWQGWLFLGVFAASTVGFTLYLARYDRPLLERRLKAGPQHEQERSQKNIVSLVYVVFFVFIVLPVLDHRFGFSPVAPWVSVLGNVMVVLSFLFMFRVLKVNSYAASNIRVEANQKVRLFVGIPLALDSWWTIGLIVW